MPEPASPQVKTPELTESSPRTQKFIEGDRVVVLEKNAYDNVECDPGPEYPPLAGMYGRVVSASGFDIIRVQLLGRALGKPSDADRLWTHSCDSGIWNLLESELEHCD